MKSRFLSSARYIVYPLVVVYEQKQKEHCDAIVIAVYIVYDFSYFEVTAFYQRNVH